jgi:hypothetical protein
MDSCEDARVGNFVRCICEARETPCYSWSGLRSETEWRVLTERGRQDEGRCATHGRVSGRIFWVRGRSAIRADRMEVQERLRIRIGW